MDTNEIIIFKKQFCNYIALSEKFTYNRAYTFLESNLLFLRSTTLNSNKVTDVIAHIIKSRQLFNCSCPISIDQISGVLHSYHGSRFEGKDKPSVLFKSPRKNCNILCPTIIDVLGVSYAPLHQLRIWKWL